MNQSQRIIVGILIFVAAMFAWAAFTNFNWWSWSLASPRFWSYHHWNYAPFLVLFIIFAMKRNRRWQRDYEERTDRPDRPEGPDRPGR